jgi:CelD/BcsL family acetyltransferase involved in cellulose biosynthesis
MIERAIDERRPRFDFLKGDETYKFRLGAEERPLYRLKARR